MQDLSISDKDRLLSSIRSLEDEVSGARAAFDKDRQISTPIFKILSEKRLFRLWLPKELGGLGLSPSDFLDVVEAASTLDGSVGWLVGNGGGMARAGGYLPKRSAEQIFSDPNAFIVAATGAVGRAVTVNGGYRVSGQWPFGSGAHHGTYFVVLCDVEERDPCDPARTMFVYVPASAVTTLDTWHVSGLRGTGSCDFAMADVFVSSDFTHAFQAEPTVDGAIYRLPTRSVFPFTVATVPLGIAVAASRSFCQMAADHKRSGASASLGSSEVIQSELGRLRAQVDAARCLLRHSMEVLCGEVSSQGTATEESRARFRGACTLAGETASNAVAKYCDMAGARAIFESCDLERCERDVRAAVKHVAMSTAAYVTNGMFELGQDISGRRF
ncbi:hypothetical protein OU426_13435 [Frigidibacter sp. RF13]|uniref:hypothetical protein n=1 Tax=Frigidibacter sp. RF13 TaxID=2997340 RepID=UPI002270F9E3|nr:hypothetical protein [Frigidibacter sp. RF13]MCY1127861.1 hypothetical protein [Frigidibacter sp. RF13]